MWGIGLHVVLSMNPFSQPVEPWVDPRGRESMFTMGIAFGCGKWFVERVLATSEEGVRQCADRYVTTDGHMLKMLEAV